MRHKKTIAGLLTLIGCLIYLIISLFHQSVHLKTCNNKIDSLKVSISKADMKIASDKAELTALTQKANYYKTKYSESDRQVIDLSAKIDEIKKILSKTTINRNELAAKLHNLQKDYALACIDANNAKDQAKQLQDKDEWNSITITDLKETINRLKPELDNLSMLREQLAPRCMVMFSVVSTPDAWEIIEKIKPFIANLSSQEISMIYSNKRFTEISYKYHLDPELLFMASKTLGYIPPENICKNQVKQFIQSALQSDLKTWSVNVFGCDSSAMDRVCTNLQEVYKNL